MQKQHLRDLTVVLPTYQRPIYALRNMYLLDQTGARVHVLDGSPTPLGASLRSGLSSRVNYVHLPVSYEERMTQALELVDTPYCVSLSDDDQHLPSGLAASLDALRADPELVAATGTALVFRRDGSEVVGRMIYPGLRGRSIDGSDPAQRMVDHLGDYLPSSVYAVTRTASWQRAVRTVTGKRFVPIRLGELQYEMTVAYEGKTTVVPQLMWLRSLENQPQWAADDMPFTPWWKQATASGERDEFGEYMGRALTDDPMHQGEAARGAVAAIDAYMSALSARTALRASLDAGELEERFPTPPELPLVEWARRVEAEGIAVDTSDLSAAISAVEATPAEVPQDVPDAWTGHGGPLKRAVKRFGRPKRGSS